MGDAHSPAFRASLEVYEREADHLLRDLQAGLEPAAWRFKWLHPRFRGRHVAEVRAALLGLDDARLVVARDHAFASWPDLVRFSDEVAQDGPVARFETAVEAVVSGDLATLEALLAAHPGLARARSTRRHHATLLHYLAANGVEDQRQRTPANAVAIAQALLAAGAEPDALADMYDARWATLNMLVSSSHPDEAGLQTALAELLLDHGASLAGAGSTREPAILTALTFGYLDTARALARRAAPPDHLAVAAGLGLRDQTARLLPAADAGSRHAALALAAQHGHAEVVGLLLEAGEDPDRYNPPGHHPHATPLHQAVAAGHADVVRLLVERGARLDQRDTLWDGTPLGWAEHCQRPALAEYLRAHGAR